MNNSSEEYSGAPFLLGVLKCHLLHTTAPTPTTREQTLPLTGWDNHRANKRSHSIPIAGSERSVDLFYYFIDLYFIISATHKYREQTDEVSEAGDGGWAEWM